MTADPKTPMMKQYFGIRRQVPEDTILFFRLGDFYEMFFEDAKTASRILDITLTKRHDMPMCGIPYHAAEGYLARILKAGRKVAICDQVEDAAEAKGIVRREVTRVITPGTVLDDPMLEAGRNNFLAGFCLRNNRGGLAWLDLSTGTFQVAETRGLDDLADHLARIRPAELIVPEQLRDTAREHGLEAVLPGMVLSAHEDWTFDPDVATETLTRHFKVHSLDGFGCPEHSPAAAAAGAVLHYVTRELRRSADHVRRFRVEQPGEALQLDEATLGNLDLVPVRGERTPTLLGVLDTTRSALGSRTLRAWLLQPLCDLPRINERHDTVAALVGDRTLLHELRDQLGEIKDLERLIARLGSGSGNARDLRAVVQSLEALPALKACVGTHEVGALPRLSKAVHPLPELCAELSRAIMDEPPAILRDGGIIRPGYHAELDELRSAATEGRQWIADFQAREQERTGIKSLKIRHNKVFGYYIEVTKANLADVPPEYVRKQTLVNAERFITPDLKEYENRILGAQERSTALEFELFTALREKVVAETGHLQETASAVGELDVLGAFADRALALRYTRPRMHDGDRIDLRDGRHPVIESMLEAEPFVPNDTQLDDRDHQILIITGPNMAGKSTYIRQVALLVVMAHAGSFVPAAEAEIALVDRVFTRVGASDDLARGRSTFMVEMQETANILNNATPRSLIVLDEIGRGTSTFDGISIAWAVAEHLHNNAEVKAKTLFATHYHELTDLALTLPGVHNLNVLVREKDDRIAFLRKIVPGGADKSYGIQVARLAGLPPPVIGRAKEILSNLEEGEFGEGGQPKIARHRPRRPKVSRDQLSLFDADPSDLP